MDTLYVLGGKQRKSTIGVPEWSQYERGTVLRVDPLKQKVGHQHYYDSPADCKPNNANASVLFKSGSIHGNHLYVCTQTEVLVYKLPEFSVNYHISLKCFNDVHHVIPTPRETLLVVISGLDLVVEITLTGDIVNEWFTAPESNWTRFSRTIDYRKIASTKPHSSHPNFVLQHENKIWVTRFEQKDCLCLTEKGQINIEVERPHDGHLLGDLCFFTTVNGQIIVADMKKQTVIQQYDLREFEKNPSVLGWCRGLHIIDENRVIVGFSRIRPTTIHNNLLWLKKQLKNETYQESRPTRIALYNLKQKSLEWEMDLEPHGLNAIFSVLTAN